MANVCNLAGFGSQSNNNCLGKGGIKRLWLTKCENIDWEATGDDVIAADDDELDVAPTMISSAVFVEVLFRKQGAVYNWERPDVLQEYNASIITIINGHDAATRKAINDTLGCCCLAGFVLGQDNVLRFFGYDWDPGEQIFIEPTQGMMLGRHLDTSGDFGGDLLNLSRNEITWSGIFASTPLIATIATSAIPIAP